MNRWNDFEHVENLHEFRADELDLAQFRKRFLDHLHPCVIRNAASSWPPFGNFSLEHLRRRTTANDKISRVLTQPLNETDPEERRKSLESNEPLHDFLDRLEKPDDDYLQAYGVACTNYLSFLVRDLEKIRPVGPTLRKKPRVYAPARLFLYKNGFTNWHYHPVDETITIQLIGNKELAFLGPDNEAFQVLDTYTAQSPLAHPPGIEKLRLRRAVLQPGDAVYIPPYWWHAASSVGSGATVAFTFPSPLHTVGRLRFPAARRVVTTALRTPKHWPALPLIGTAILWAKIRSRMHDQASSQT